MIFQIYSWYLNESTKNLAASASCSLRRLKAPTFGALPPTVPVGDLDRSPFHLRWAFLPDLLSQGCSSVSNPFTGAKIHRIFTYFRFTHSYGYASAADRPTLFAIFSLVFVSFMRYAG